MARLGKARAQSAARATPQAKEATMPTENTLRRRARHQGLTLVKFRETSQWYWQYGPYALTDADNRLVAWGLELAGVADEISEQVDRLH